MFVPARNLSETILEFAAPLLEPLGPVPEVDEARRAIELAINVWNFHVMASPLWGKPQYLADARTAMCGPRSSADLAGLFELLAERRTSRFDTDPRLVGEWTLAPDGSGSHSLRCESKLPEGTVPHVPPPAESRIAIGGAFLDEVRIRQTGATLLSFPASNHRAQVASDGVVTIHAQALTVAQLFADGVLKPVGGAPVDVSAGGQRLGPMELGEVRCGSRSGVGDVIVLVFRRAPPFVS